MGKTKYQTEAQGTAQVMESVQSVYTKEEKPKKFDGRVGARDRKRSVQGMRIAEVMNSTVGHSKAERPARIYRGSGSQVQLARKCKYPRPRTRNWRPSLQQ